MKLGAGKEMDRKCVLDWLNKVYISPSFSYSEYTDEELRIFAHDALVLLTEQEAVEPYIAGRGESFETAETWWYECGDCNKPIDPNDKFCRHCGKAVKWE